MSMNKALLQEVESPESLVQATTDVIREKIVSRQLRGGASLNERRLSEQLGLSRTPVRAALRQLEGEGLLGREGRTVFVRTITFEEVMQILAVRLVLEIEAVRLAIGRFDAALIREIRDELLAMTDSASVGNDKHWEIDDKLHLGIAHASGNDLLHSMIMGLRMRTRMFGTKRIPGRFEPGRQEHLALLDAIAAGDSERAIAAMRAHLTNTRDSIVATVQGGPL
jgi:DNA-binding GntR family transcriptional regulator